MSSSYLVFIKVRQCVLYMYYFSPAIKTDRQFEGVSFCFLCRFALPEFTISQSEIVSTVPYPAISSHPPNIVGFMAEFRYGK